MNSLQILFGTIFTKDILLRNYKTKTLTQLDKLNNDIKSNTDIDYAVEKFKEIAQCR